MNPFDGQHDRKPLDHYPTLDACHAVPALAQRIDWLGRVWEPHCGSFHLVDEMRKLGADVLASDIELYDRDPDMLIDFLKIKQVPEGVRTIVMNPPFDQLDAHLERALEMMDGIGQVCLLARSDIAFAKKREPLFNADSFRGEIKLAWRLKWFLNTKEQGRHNYSWYIWDCRPGAATFQFIHVASRVDKAKAKG